MTQRPSPSAEELRRLYAGDDLPMDALARRWGVGRSTVRQWLHDAGIPIRTKQQSGARRTRLAPPPEELRRLHETEGLSPGAMAERLGVSRTTIVRWLDDADIPLRRSSRKGRMRGQYRAVPPPGAERLRELYEARRLSISQVADELGASVHLVRGWLDAEGIAKRRYTSSSRRTPPRRRIQPPPPEELKRLRQGERWRLADLAARYGVHHGTVARWLAEYGIDAVRSRGALPGVTVADVVHCYVEGEETAAQLARRLGVPYGRVLDELRRAGVTTNRRRQRRPRKLSADDIAWATARHVVDGWSLGPIAEHLSCTTVTVSRALKANGVDVSRRPSPSRHDRIEAPVERVEELYVRDRQTAEQVGDALDVRGGIILRTGHAHGLPIRPPGPNPRIPAEVHLIEALYGDELVSDVLTRHGVDRRPAVGAIAVRFPEPEPLTPDLVRELYVVAGCSSLHIELLTGQSEAVVRRRMHEWGIAFRSGPRNAPALRRIRRQRRLAWLEAVVASYGECRSTARIAADFGCSQETVRRWLLEAGVSLPGRGCWERHVSERASLSLNRSPHETSEDVHASA